LGEQLYKIKNTKIHTQSTKQSLTHQDIFPWHRQFGMSAVRLLMYLKM